MVSAYFDRKIKRQNRFIYLKKGRWLVILWMLALSVVLVESRLHIHDGGDTGMFRNIGITALAALPYLLSVGFFILFLIPYFFKRSKYRQFWIGMILALLVATLLEILVLSSLESMARLPVSDASGTVLFFKCLFNQIGNILGMTGVLYIFEIFEEINLAKESILNLQVWKESERQLKGTKTDFPYMLQSLRGINSKLKGDGRINESTTASESMLLFADILRYKLYGYDQICVPVAEELDVVSNLVKFYNSVMEKDTHRCDMEVVGDQEPWMIEKQLLVNIVYPFLKNSESPFFSNLICFVELEGGVMNLTIQADYTIQVEMEQILEKVKESVAKNTEITNFETQVENSYIILNICLTLTKRLTA